MEFDRYLSGLPEYEFAITYGSGVFPQKGYSAKDVRNAMLDVILGVENLEEWHLVNLAKNPQHYSWIRHLNAKSVAKLDEVGFGHVLYNRSEMGPEREKRPVKYGVISLSSLKRDLLTWDSLYVAGRLQKPVCILKAREDIIRSMNENLKSAVLAVLPLLPPRFSARELFLAITGLSYNGDIRTWFAENPNKVENIVSGNYDYFNELYKPIIQNCPFIHAVEGETDQYCQDITMKNLACILASLPSTLHPSIRQELQFSTPSVDVSSLSSTALYDVYYRRLSALYDPYETNQNIMVAKAAVAKGLVNGVRHVVFRSSIDQAVRGNISFGVMNSLSYVAKKIKKFLK